MPEFRKFVWAYGIETRRRGREYVGNCPLCIKEDHFYVNDAENLWDCKSCGGSGNHITFLNRLWGASSEDVADLAKDRGLKEEILHWAGVRKSEITGDYLLPVKNAKGNIVNLYHTVEDDDGKMKVLSSPSPCKQQLYLGEHLRKNPYLFICEGQWDTLAMAETLQRLQYRGDKLVAKAYLDQKESLWSQYDLVGVPGATTFLEPWLPLLKDRNIVLLYDNDDGGRAGIKRLVRLIRDSNIHVESIQVMSWADDDVNDYRDLFLSQRPRKAFTYVKEHFSSVATGEEEKGEQPAVEPEECASYEELLGRYREHFHVTPAIEDTLATMLAVTLAVQFPGEQLGLRVMGPPGSLKSTLAECIGVTTSLVYPTSKFTGLISGFLTIKRAQQIGERINGKCLLIKDADVMTQLPNWHQVESELRDALGDGVIRADFKTGKSEEIYLDLSVVMCGTRALLRIDDAQLGSRFVNIFIQQEEDSIDDIVEMSMKSQFRMIQDSLGSENGDDTAVKGKAVIRLLGPPTAGFLLSKHEQLKSGMNLQEPSPLRWQQLKAMSSLVCWSRAKVERQGSEILCYRPEMENPTRVSNQLFRIGLLLSLVRSNKGRVAFGKKTIESLQRITRDTCFGFPFEVIKDLYSFPEGLTTEQIAMKRNLSVTQVRRQMNDLLELKIVERKRVKNPHGQGRKNHFFVLADEVRGAYKIAFSRK